MSDQKATEGERGWWVPTPQYWRQTLLPHSGCWQWVRTADGKEHKAVVLSGMGGWLDTNYRPIPKVTDWFKPARWFHHRADLEGKRGELEALRQRSGSILRGAA